MTDENHNDNDNDKNNKKNWLIIFIVVISDIIQVK